MALNQDKWGRKEARSRYGKLDSGGMKPDDVHAPQKLGDRNNLQGPGYTNDTGSNSWLTGGGKGGEGKPDFDKGPVHGRKV